MNNPLDWWRQRQARRRFMPRPRRPKAGTTAKMAGIAMLVIVAVAALLELRRGGGAEGEFVTYARDSAADPLDLIEVAARSRRLLFLADIPSAPAPKRFAARAIERIATTSGLDILVLDIDADEQPFIDLYLATAPEDASILLSRPRAIRERDGESRTYLDIYRAVWRVNEKLGADRRIRILAADRPGWPPARSASPGQAAIGFGERDEHMLQTVMARALGRSPNARVLFFMDGFHAMRAGGARVQTGGAKPVEMTWLAAQLAARFPQDVYSILVDAAPSRVVGTDVAAYRGTDFTDVLRRAGMPDNTALRVTPMFDALSRTPIRVIGTTGSEFSLQPRDLPFSQVADAYIYFGN